MGYRRVSQIYSIPSRDQVSPSAFTDKLASEACGSDMREERMLFCEWSVIQFTRGEARLILLRSQFRSRFSRRILARDCQSRASCADRET